MTTYNSRFAIGDKVMIDGCGDLKAIVTAVLWRNERPTCEVSWVSGTSHAAWVEEWRLEKHDG